MTWRALSTNPWAEAAAEVKTAASTAANAESAVAAEEKAGRNAHSTDVDSTGRESKTSARMKRHQASTLTPV
jgi:hypothetical protein